MEGECDWQFSVIKSKKWVNVLSSICRPVAGSLTEARGQKANIHVCREMLELCEIISSEGYAHCEETPKLKVILFGELFNVSSIEIWPNYLQVYR